MKKYIIAFGISYAVLTVAIAALSIALHKGGASLNLVAVFGASFIAAGIFAKDKSRQPTKEEKSRYALGSLGASLLVSGILVAATVGLVISSEEVTALRKILSSGIGLAAGTVALILVSAVYYAAIKWSFSWYASLAVR
jgi:hypothetical protein